MASSVTASRQRIFTLLEGADWTSPDPQVTYGPPKHHEENEVVALLGIEAEATDFATLGTGTYEEQFSVILQVKVWDPGATDPSTVDARGFGLYETIRTVVHADPTLAGSVLWCHVDAPRTQGVRVPVVENNRVGEGWVIFLDVPVACVARAT